MGTAPSSVPHAREHVQRALCMCTCVRWPQARGTARRACWHMVPSLTTFNYLKLHLTSLLYWLIRTHVDSVTYNSLILDHLSCVVFGRNLVGDQLWRGQAAVILIEVTPWCRSIFGSEWLQLIGTWQQAAPLKRRGTREPLPFSDGEGLNCSPRLLLLLILLLSLLLLIQ